MNFKGGIKLQGIKLQDEKLERYVIGSMLYDSKVADYCIIRLQADSFANSQYKQLFNFMAEMYKQGTGIDVTTVMAYINKTGFASSYPLTTVSALVAEVSTTAQIKTNIRDLKELEYRRKVYKYADNVKNLVTNETDIHKVINILTELPQTGDKTTDKTTGQIIADTIERATDRLQHKREIQGEPIGLTTVDRVTGGLKQGEFILLTANPNVGKSLLALQICINFAKRDKKALYFNFEMNEKQIGDRLVVMGADFDVAKLKSPIGLTTAEELNAISIDPLVLDNLGIFTNTQKNIASIRWKCKELQARGKQIDLIVVDYLQMMTAEGKTELEQIDNLSKGLKSIATEFNTSVLVISSLNRQNQLRGSGRLDFDADQIYYLERDHNAPLETDRMNAKLKVTKNRDGGKGEFELLFVAKYLKFYCPPPYKVERIKPEELPEEFTDPQTKLNIS